MYKLFLVTFAVLAWAFYALSGGSEFTPPADRAATAPVLATYDRPPEPEPVIEAEEPAPTITIAATEQEDIAPVTATVAQDLRRVSGTRVNMRAGPSTNDAVVITLTRGTQVEVLGENADGWAELRVVETDETGWMAARFLEAE